MNLQQRHDDRNLTDPLVSLGYGYGYLYGFGLEAMEQSGDWYYFLADGLGSTMSVVDDAGTVQNSYTYDVYGEASVTGSLANEFDFAGQQTDGETGLQYLRARYMDPETGVFFSRDPLAAMPSWLGSHFGYASGNPATATDPTGLCDDGSPACLGTESPTPPAPDGWHFWAWVGLEDPGPLMWLEWKQSGIGPHVRLCRLVDEYRTCGEEILYEKASKAGLADEIWGVYDHFLFILAGMSLDEILANDWAFRRYIGHHNFPADKPFSQEDSQKLWQTLKDRGYKPRCDPGGVRGSVWKDVDHINVQVGGRNVHIPVANGFCSGAR